MEFNFIMILAHSSGDFAVRRGVTEIESFATHTEAAAYAHNSAQEGEIVLDLVPFSPCHDGRRARMRSRKMTFQVN